MANIPEGFAQTNIRWSGGNYPYVMEVCLGWDVGDSPLDPQGVGDVIADALETVFNPALIATNLACTQILTKFGPNETGPSALSTCGFVGSGGAGGGAAVSVLMSKLTGLGGRRGRGRAFWPGVPEAQVDQGGLLASGTVATWLSELEDFYDKVLTELITPVLLHSDAGAPTPQTGIAVSGVVATQRRRQRR